jgi:hypothetical protein
MLRAFCMTALLAISPCAFGQVASSDTQTLQALLSELRALRQDLRVSLNRTQGSQILLARLQLQEEAVTQCLRPSKRRSPEALRSARPSERIVE